MTETLLTFLLKRLDLLDKPLVSHGEVSRFHRDHLRSFLSEGVLRETSQATEVTRNGIVLSVIRGKHGLYGVPEQDEYYSPVKVENHEVTQYEILGNRVAELIRAKNGITGTVRLLSPRLFDLGERELPNKSQAKIFLSLVNDDSGGLMALCSYLKSNPPNISLILLPCEPAISPSSKERLAKTGCMILALDKHLQSNWVIPFGEILDKTISEPQRNGGRENSEE